MEVYLVYLDDVQVWIHLVAQVPCCWGRLPTKQTYRPGYSTKPNNRTNPPFLRLSASSILL